MKNNKVLEYKFPYKRDYTICRDAFRTVFIQ